MKFTVDKLPQAKAEIDSLEQSQKEMLEADYKKIQEQGIEFVRVKPIQKEIFEIKTNELRSLFKYAAGRIIVVGVVFVKKTWTSSRISRANSPRTLSCSSCTPWASILSAIGQMQRDAQRWTFLCRTTIQLFQSRQNQA